MAAHSETPRWLDDDEREAWLALVRVIILLPQALDRQLRRDASMTHFDYFVLVMLSEAEGRTLRMTGLAALTEGSLPRLSQVVRKLEQRGWVTRSPDPADRRSTLATMTEAGFEAIAAHAPGHVDTVRRLVFDAIGPQGATAMTTVCQAITAAIEAEAADSGDR